MKKSLFFLLIIFSVFSFYSVAFADPNPLPTTNILYDINPSTHVGYFYANHTSPLYNIEYIVYSGIYPDTSTVLSHQYGSFSPSSMNISIYAETHYWEFINSSAQHFIYQVFYSGGVWTQTTLGNDITPLTPADSSTVPATLNFTGTYNNDGTYNEIVISINNTTLGTSTNFSCGTPATSYNLTYSCTYNGNLLTNYTYNALLFDNAQTFPFGATVSSTISFATSDIYTVAPDFGGNNCSTFDIGCYLQQALQYLFTPSSASLDQFSGLYQLFIHKPPFGYVSAINGVLSNINDTETSVFTLQSLPILNSYIFTPLRVALVWVLWVAFAFVLFHRLKNIHL